MSKRRGKYTGCINANNLILMLWIRAFSSKRPDRRHFKFQQNPLVSGNLSPRAGTGVGAVHLPTRPGRGSGTDCHDRHHPGAFDLRSAKYGQTLHDAWGQFFSIHYLSGLDWADQQPGGTSDSVCGDRPADYAGNPKPGRASMVWAHLDGYGNMHTTRSWCVWFFVPQPLCALEPKCWTVVASRPFCLVFAPGFWIIIPLIGYTRWWSSRQACFPCWKKREIGEVCLRTKRMLCGWGCSWTATKMVIEYEILRW